MIKFEKNLLFKIFEMTYNLKRREYLVIKYYVRAYRPSEMDGLPRYYDIRGWCNRSRGIDSCVKRALYKLSQGQRVDE